jgi:mycoredoxin-dependent peroxiredoxin
MAVEVGHEAPDFELPNQHRQLVRLARFRGQKNIVLVFYPLAFTPICTGEICAIRDEGAGLDNDSVQVLAVSCDPASALKVFAKQQAVTYHLLSDFWPHGAVARAYGAFLDDKGIATRATYIIDRSGIVRWAMINPPGEARDPADYEMALQAIAAQPFA